METLQLININKYFGTGTSRVHVLKDINFTAKKGEVNLVIGPSGSGKSTFLTIAGGLQTPTDGSVQLEGDMLKNMSSKQRDALRLNSIGFVLQSYSLVPYLTVKEQFKLVKKVKKQNNLTNLSLTQLMEKLGIEDLVNKYPGELSGGQNQRVAIARALYTKPDILLADEPTAALDSERVAEVGQIFQDLAREQNTAVIIVTHDLRLINFADNVYKIMDGQMTLENDMKLAQ
ncbi:ABC transporter ATP-binding protein [Companilactobacillus nantensis]|uniref:Putative hemin import ATP-binding protein HrtA n=1 Tax=Companilactobacillus nantensis DSM 16982 TaxID=1423774 RepID=A0A0R1WJB9_9LACO|nr:ABC transporter ATP-binding protein [Companilactobacillus nantensis]KRM17968.1 lipoprotein releasing system, ATP-binding protein [Companilactobacillus nantensis DSM 16982]GEO63631.1 ABC transporter ATP-binding protein [Companilactobacillus nantensis]